jgi:hypothetical protein
MNKDTMIYVGIGIAAVAVVFLLYKNAKNTSSFTSVGVGTQSDLTWGEMLENIILTGNSRGYTSYDQGPWPTFLGLTY